MRYYRDIYNKVAIELLCDIKRKDKMASKKSNRFVVVSHIPEQREALKEAVKNYPFWAYIDHFPDSECQHEHTHFMFRIKGCRSCDSIAKELEIPSNFVEVLRFDRAYCRYFVHKDSPEKRQYKLEDIKTSSISRFKSALVDNYNDDCASLSYDLFKVKERGLTPDQFIEKHYIEIQNLNFYQKFNLITNLRKLYENE